MLSFKSMDSMVKAIEDGSVSGTEDIEYYRKIVWENEALFKLLRFLEKTNPCEQRYYLYKRVIIISYIMSWEFFKIGKKHCIRGRFRVIGLPVSLPNPGYLIANEDEETRSSIERIIKEAADSLKGITIVLNADKDISDGRLAPSNFVFYNRFQNFEEYLSALRSSYRRKIKNTLKRGRELRFIRLEKGRFTQEHYDLYLSVCNRTKMVFRILPFDFFRDWYGEIFEVRDGQNRLLAMIQLLDVEKDLYFLYVGFKEDHDEDRQTSGINNIDLYFNLLLFIIRYGIEKGYNRIVFGQTSEESKSKVGCVQELKYVYISSSNPLVRIFFRIFPRFYSFEPYSIVHNVFK
ncbi:MAG: GNAT family N-acetyltransferase [Clostridiales bacterium]|nr:GNAT family N-acetyltransferase [Clostridiales bacterium]